MSKHEHLVNGIMNSIEEGVIQKGDQLPSINKMVDTIGYARKTIVKAYEELKERGIVESKNFKGYFISSDKTDQVLKVALVLYAFGTIQENFYNVFKSHTNPNIEIEVFFHHNSVSALEEILDRIDRKYGFYVIAPIEDSKIKTLLQKIPPSKLLIVDRYYLPTEEYSHITQEFDKSTYDNLKELLPSIREYKELILLYIKNSAAPLDAIRGFKRFLKDFNIPGRLQGTYEDGVVEKGSAYYVLSDDFLWRLLRDCRNQKLTIAKDIGIIGHNDNLIKELISGGITTISTDFEMMGKLAADCVNNQNKVQIHLPTYLKKRISI